MRVRSSSRFNRVISETLSAGDGIDKTVDATAREFAGSPRTTVRQFLSINGEILLGANRDSADLGAAAR